MALYLGGKSVKINLNGSICRINIPLGSSVLSLLSSDGFMLKDSNGLILMAKEEI